MKTCFCPFDSKSNKYVEIIKSCLNSRDIEVYSINKILKNRELFKEIKIYNFNWYESVARKKYWIIPKVILKIIFIKYLRIRGKKIIWTMHNKEPHNSKSGYWTTYMMRFMSKNSHKIVILCEESKVTLKNFISDDEINKKATHINLPNYIGVYNNDLKVKMNIEENSFVLLFVGSIQPYKNIEILIDVANKLNNENISFIIAGKPGSVEYGESLKARVKSNKVTMRLEFIDDDKLVPLIELSDALVLPYDTQSSLNSATIMLAFSNKKTVISPLIGTLKNIKNDNLYISYDYLTEEEHKEKLTNAILNLYNKSRSEVKVMGERCYLYVKENNNTKIIANNYSKLYNNLIGIKGEK